MYTTESLAVHLKLTQHCKLMTVLKRLKKTATVRYQLISVRMAVMNTTRGYVSVRTWKKRNTHARWSVTHREKGSPGLHGHAGLQASC